MSNYNCLTIMILRKCRANYEELTSLINICGLSDEEVARYVLHKIACAGGSESIMDKAALSAIHSHSQGNPRLIDNLMSDALALGSQMEKKTIDAEVVLAAVNNQNLI